MKLELSPWAAPLAIVAALTACAPRDDGAVAFIEGLYAPYSAERSAAPPDVLALDVFTPELKAQVDRAVTNSALLDEPIIDADPIVWAQDWKISDLKVARIESPKDGGAALAARFNNLGKASEVRFVLRRIDGQWRINDIESGADDFRKMIDRALAPSGDRVAMEAPVRAIYAAYTMPGKSMPLEKVGSLSASLRKQLERAAHAPSPVLDFDPRVDAKRPAVGPVAYEAAGSSVIVRFENNGSQKLLVYDLAEKEGSWTIVDVRSPGQWSLVQKLSAAGFTPD